MDAASSRVRQMDQAIQYDVGVRENLPYLDDYFDAVVCVEVLEYITDVTKVIAEVARVLKSGGVFLYDTINRNSIARLATITLAEDVFHLLPKWTHDPEMFIKSSELYDVLSTSGLVPLPQTGLGRVE